MAPKIACELEIAKLAKQYFLDLPGTENFRQVLLAADDEVAGAYEPFFRKIAMGNLRPTGPLSSGACSLS